jgi:uncharacterized membrane protein
MRNLGFTWLDLFALAWFFLWWVGYARFAGWHGKRVPSLLSAMEKYRRDWWVPLERELRMIDTAIIANLSNSSTFFLLPHCLFSAACSHCWALPTRCRRWCRPTLQPADVGGGLGAEDPLAGGNLRLRVFKFTWSIRQFNIASVLVGAAPQCHATPRTRPNTSSAPGA